jgi:hypothetical protein
MMMSGSQRFAEDWVQVSGYALAYHVVIATHVGRRTECVFERRPSLAIACGDLLFHRIPAGDLPRRCHVLRYDVRRLRLVQRGGFVGSVPGAAP